MPIYDYQDLKINYMREGSGSPLLFLHGWGADLTSFNVLADALKKRYDVIALDFPGFGKSDEPKTPWNLDDYTAFTESFTKDLGIINPVLLGHSFGGRVSIKLASKVNPPKIVLMNSAGIKPKRSTSYYFRVYGYKFFRTVAALPLLKWILSEPLEAYRAIYSSSDYKQASPIMKQVLSKVVNEDLRHHLKAINVPVLLIWGDQDQSTPIEDARLMEKLIPDAGLVVYEGAGHFSYLEQPAKTLTILGTFLGGK